MKVPILHVLLCLCLFTAGNAAWGGESPRGADVESWQADRFGLFIHWGPVSLKGTEIGWSRAGERRGLKRAPGTEVPVEIYDNLFRQFNPVHFNAKEWVAIAQAAGMKYLVFTTRHHDGFSMFDTQADDYKITNPASPFRRDVVRELADACHEAGLKFGLYYSQPNWHDSDSFSPDRHHLYLAYLKTQIRELMSNYGRVDILWYDGLGKKAEDYDAVNLNRLARDLQPHILINNRNGLPEDFDTPEQRVGKYQDDRPWESCITICRQWSWKPNDEMKSLKECVQTLIMSAGGDGNLLLNVGPMPDGRIEQRQIDRLKEMGAWLARNGRAIYGTRGGPWKPNKSFASTRRDKTVFLHILRRDTGVVQLPALPVAIKSAVTMDGTAVRFSQHADKVVLFADSLPLDPIDTIICLELEKSAMAIPAIPLAEEIKATSSNPVTKSNSRNDPSFAFDNEPRTRWSPEGGATSGWIAADLGKARTIQRVRIEEGGEERVTRFAFQYRTEEGWKTLFNGATLGRWFQRQFEPVTAREFRLEIISATEAPSIADIEFFEK